MRLAESLTTFLSLLALLLVLLATRRPGSPTLWQVGVAGVILGVAALGRPNLLLLPPLVAVWLWFPSRSQDPAVTGRSRLRPAVVLLAIWWLIQRYRRVSWSSVPLPV